MMNTASLVDNFGNLMILSLVVGIPLLAACRRVKVYESFIDGAKDGFDLIIKIFPYLLAMLVAIGMLRASGAFDLLDTWLGPFFAKLGVPTQVVPLALIRPFSGSASNGILVDIIHKFGGDAFVSHLAATMMGSTETTFYVIALYFGAAGIRRTRHAIPAGLIADTVGVIASVVVCRLLLA
jgi:spore maturation protein B